jgi:hypothetical protein
VVMAAKAPSGATAPGCRANSRTGFRAGRASDSVSRDGRPCRRPFIEVSILVALLYASLAPYAPLPPAIAGRIRRGQPSGELGLLDVGVVPDGAATTPAISAGLCARELDVPATTRPVRAGLRAPAGAVLKVQPFPRWPEAATAATLAYRVPTPSTLRATGGHARHPRTRGCGNAVDARGATRA